MSEHDPFEDPTPPAVVFASADSFRGRLVMIEPTKVERDIPKVSSQPSGPKGDRITANVTVLDGKGDVQAYKNKVPTGQTLPGPVYRKVWFNQDQIASGLQTVQGQLRGRVLAVLDTYKPGQPAGQGNPWTLIPATAEQKSAAVKELARIKAEEELGAASSSAPAEDESPFA